MGKDRRSSSVDDWKDFLECDVFCRWCFPCSGEYAGEESSVLGVRGEADPDEDSSLDGDNSGTGTEDACEELVRLEEVWGWVN
jgi:hypothetical protein